MAIALYGADQHPSDRADLRHRRATPSINRWARRTAATNCVRNSPEPAAALLGSARTTTRSATSSSAHDVPTTCRNLRVTRCRSTAPPTALVTTKPTFGPPPPSSRRRWTTRSGWAARTPRWTVRPKSADRVSRFRAGSTSTYDPRVRQSARDDPCAAAPRQWPCPPGSASANGSHGPWPGGGCSAGKSACPWPRLHLLVMSGGTGKGPPAATTFAKSHTNRRSPELRSLPCRPWWRRPEGTEVDTAGQTAPIGEPLPLCTTALAQLASTQKPVSFCHSTSRPDALPVALRNTL